MLIRNESFKEYLKLYPITSAIIALNILVMLYTSLRGGLHDESVLYQLGGIDHETIAHGEYYRFIFYAFIHNGFSHLIFNMFAIAIFGAPIERILGKVQYLVLFFGTVIATGLFIYLFSNDGGVGASGFGYGMLGLFFYWILFKKGMIDQTSKTAIIAFIVMGWITTFVIPSVSILGHLGGFLAGFVLGKFFKIGV